MAEIAVSAVITVLCEKLVSGDLTKLARSLGIDSQLNKWNKNLPLIQEVLSDASEKHITDKDVQLWVNEIQKLAYDIEDVLDDLFTEALRRKLNQEAHANTSSRKVLKFVPNCCININPRNIMYSQKMSSKLDQITTKLGYLVDLKKGLGLNAIVEKSNRTERRLEQTSLVYESEIIGREEVKEALLGKLLGNERCDRNVSIVSIIGMGGIGKTTLAKVLYDEKKVNDHFEVRAWVCVSEELDVSNVSKAIFHAATGQNKDFANLDLLHVALKEKLSKKKFLLVLDDVWNEDYSTWELLQSPLLVGAPGSRVIVTTRKSIVTEVMDSEENYLLSRLSDEDALSLFAHRAVGEKNFGSYPTLKLLGEDIVKKCSGLPLALTMLGRVLMGNRDGDEWEKLLKSEIWCLNNREILPALRISYYHLPPHLKQLFAYCSLIPKGYVFDKNELVLLWVAEGFLSESKRNKSMEHLGHRYFEELKSRSFFQHPVNDDLGYIMHDMISDLATSVAREFSFRWDGEMNVSYMKENFDKFRHFSLVGPRYGLYRILKGLQRAKSLRTLLLISVGWNVSLDKVLLELLPKLQELRVLSVMGTAQLRYIGRDTLSIRKVPQSIGSLKHLRYLNFSYTGISCLPEEVSELYNLQSLLVHNCHQLSSLPRSFAKLINLRHLDISDTPKLIKLPSGIGGLTSLQTLPKVMIEEAKGFKISDLKVLSDLQGRLSIVGLDKVISPIQAKDANLHQKKGLEVLKMEWSDVFNDSRNEIIEYEVLQELRPHPMLKSLEIVNNKGTRFPSWLGDPSFDQLTEIKLYGCRSTHLPALGHLPYLKKLVVERMNEVKTVGFEFLSPTNSNNVIAFPSLEVLKFNHMQHWQRWSIYSGDDHGTLISLPCLREISLVCCPELAQVSVGLLPSLRVLYIEVCSVAVLRSIVGSSPAILELNLVNVKGLTQLHEEVLMHLGPVKDLYIDTCDDLRYLWERESEACKTLVCLQMLKVYNCKKLVSSAKKEVSYGISMESLKEVWFSDCDTLESYNCPNSVKRLDISGCGSLTSLNISFCKNLKSFSYEHFQSLTSLKELSIQYCPGMDYSFPCGSWPPNLRKLTIGCLNKPMSVWGWQNFPTSLVKLSLHGKNSGVVSFAVADDVGNTTTPSTSFLLPPSLISLELHDFTDVESFSEVLQHLPCLKRLEIVSCPKIRDLNTTSGPSNLTITVSS